jgi:hypothetical protein
MGSKKRDDIIYNKVWYVHPVSPCPYYLLELPEVDLLSLNNRWTRNVCKSQASDIILESQEIVHTFV